METTVLIENLILLILTGYALSKRQYYCLVLMVIVNVSFMLFDNLLLNTLDVQYNNYDNTSYYTLLSFFFIGSFGLFLTRITGMSIIFAACMLLKAISCFLMAINGAQLNNAQLPEYDIIYIIYGMINSIVWVVEILTIINVEILKTWKAATTKSKL